MGVASVSATFCSANAKSYKNIKNRKEPMKYLPKIDKAEILSRSGSIFIFENVAIRCAMEREYTSQQQ